MSDKPQSRQFYRLQYPLSVRALLKARGKDFSVTEISEQGCRIEGKAAQAALFREGVTVTFSFLHGTVVETSAALIRIAEEEVVLKLSPPIPLNVMLNEQRWVIKNIPRSKD